MTVVHAALLRLQTHTLRVCNSYSFSMTSIVTSACPIVTLYVCSLSC